MNARALETDDGDAFVSRIQPKPDAGFAQAVVQGSADASPAPSVNEPQLGEVPKECGAGAIA
jgi:hypothetical protein